MRCLLLSAFVLPGALCAQASDGPLLALPHGFSVDAATALPGAGTGTLVWSEAGFDTAPPAAALPPGTPGTPNFSTWLPAPLDVDAFSLGHDWVLANDFGEIEVPPGHWGAITFSVRRTTAGLPGSLIAAEVARPDGAAADVFAYILPGSALPPPIVGIPFRAQDSTETATYQGGVRANLDAHDLYVALLYLENPQLAALLPPPTIFFSVTAAAAPMIPMAWTPVAGLRSGATVFATTWVPATSSWTMPVPYLAPSALGLTAAEDVDALALDLIRGRILFSTDPAMPPPAGARNAVLFSRGTGSNSIYRLPGLPIRPVTTEVGLGIAPDDVDGICALDPGGPGQPSQIRLPFMLGTAQQPLLPSAPTRLQASAFRRFDPQANIETLESWMTGWPPPGNPQPGFAVVGLAIGSPLGPYATLGLFTRPLVTNPFQGHPEHVTQVIPPSFSLIGAPVFFTWGAFSATTFDLSLPIGILL